MRNVSARDQWTKYFLAMLTIMTSPGCGKEAAPAPEPAPKEIAAEIKPAQNDKPAPIAAPSPESTEVAQAKPIPSAAATPTATVGAKNSPPAANPAEVAAIPMASAPAAPPIAAETAAPTIATIPPVPETPPPPPVESPKQTAQAFSVWLQSSGRYTAGQQGVVEAVVVPKGEFHCNQEYPYKFVTSANSTGVSFPKSTLRGEGLNVSSSRAVMRVPFVPQNAGEAKVGGTFHFSVCTDQQCVVEKRDVFVTVKVQ